jgi:hypothetical protein
MQHEREREEGEREQQADRRFISQRVNSESDCTHTESIKNKSNQTLQFINECFLFKIHPYLLCLLVSVEIFSEAQNWAWKEGQQREQNSEEEEESERRDEERKK